MLTATEAWEDEVVQEPTVIYENGLYKMWYTGGYSDHNALGYATSKDGVTWTKYAGNPVLGQGGSGITGNATHFSVTKHGGTYYAFYNADASSLGIIDPTLHLATSPDGVAWTAHPFPVLLPGGQDNNHANTHAWVDGNGWHLLYDSMNVATGHWLTFLAHGPDPYHLTKDPFGPLSDLAVDGGTYGGMWLTRQKNEYRIYYLASRGELNLPTDIYSADSRDLHHWKKNPGPIVYRSQPWQYDQVADPSVLTVNGEKLMYFDGLDNTDLIKMKSSIGLAYATP